MTLYHVSGHFNSDHAVYVYCIKMNHNEYLCYDFSAPWWLQALKDLVWILHPTMSSSLSPTLQTVNGMDQDEPLPLFPSHYPTALGVDRGTVCIPSPYADNGHAEMSFCGPSAPENPAIAPPLSPSLFWSSHNPHAMPALPLHCPPALPYSEPHIHTAWVDTKPHTSGRHRWRGRGLMNCPFSFSYITGILISSECFLFEFIPQRCMSSRTRLAGRCWLVLYSVTISIVTAHSQGSTVYTQWWSLWKEVFHLLSFFFYGQGSLRFFAVSR